MPTEAVNRISRADQDVSKIWHFGTCDWALVRPIPDSFDKCIRPDSGDKIDVSLAKEQQVAYFRALADAGVRVEFAITDETCPDCCFVEDCVLALGPRCFNSTCPGAEPRRAEVIGVENALAKCTQGLSPQRLSSNYFKKMCDAGATLDGGDVMRVGRTVYVGQTKRTSAAGVAWLREVAGSEGLRVQAIPVKSGLHLKCAVTAVDACTLVVDASAVDPQPFVDDGFDIIKTPEPMGANVIALGNDRILVSAAAPITATLLRARGKQVVVLEMSEIHKADGSLTCLSVRVPREGFWCC